MSSDAIIETELSENQVDKQHKPRQILGMQELSVLNPRYNWKGLVQLAGHLTVMGVSGYLWAMNFGNWLLAIPALAIYGFCIASMFAPMHECVHRTAFANNRLNDIVAWCAGLLSFYNSTFFLYYHNWHHRYTRVPDKDPELTDPKPSNLGKYLLIITGLPWWLGKIRGHFRAACGQLDDCPFVPQTARVRSYSFHSLAISCLCRGDRYLHCSKSALVFPLLATTLDCGSTNSAFYSAGRTHRLYS